MLQRLGATSILKAVHELAFITDMVRWLVCFPAPPAPGSHLPPFIYTDLGYQGFRIMNGALLDCPLLGMTMTPATTKLYTRVLITPSFYGYFGCRCDDSRQSLQVINIGTPLQSAQS